MAAGKDIRKVVQVGNASAVTLPADYFENAGIERGDKVEIIFLGSIAKIKPISETEIEEEISEGE